jgi:predicted enzyme related to lactoylglutathione lyase
MKTAFGRMVLLIRDFEEALKFYQDNFDCLKLYDTINEKGKRFLHIGFNKKTDTGIWFLKAETEEQINHIGNQTGGMPLFVIYTDDLEEIYERLIRNKVKIIKKPLTGEGFSFLHMLDLYGNEIVVVEMEK